MGMSLSDQTSSWTFFLICMAVVAIIGSGFAILVEKVHQTPVSETERVVDARIMDEEIAHWETLRMQTKERYEVRKKKLRDGNEKLEELRRKLAGNDVVRVQWQGRVVLAGGELEQLREDYAALVRSTKEAARAKSPQRVADPFPR